MSGDYIEAYGMNPNLLASITAFSEVSKQPDFFEQDAIGVLNVLKNRLSRPDRFGETMADVVFAPAQFSGVGTPEWDKAYYGNFTPEEEKIFKKILQLSYGVFTDKIPDSTGGADHYYNPKLAQPNWAKKYKQTYTSGAHDYHAELLPMRSTATKLTFDEAFSKAREAGKKAFQWRGAKYTTELKEE